MKKAVKIIAIIATLGFAVSLILSIIWWMASRIDGMTFFTSLFSNVVILILLWALHSALARIDNLEAEVTYCKKEIRKTQDGPQPQKTAQTKESSKYPQTKIIDNYVCKTCGSELTPDDEVCPKCRTPRGKSNK